MTQFIIAKFQKFDIAMTKLLGSYAGFSSEIIYRTRRETNLRATGWRIHKKVLLNVFLQ